MTRRLAALVALLSLAGACGSGCATVQPWERGRLSHSCMKMKDRMGDAYLAHVVSIREGSVGGEGSAGGGCGCN